MKSQVWFIACLLLFVFSSAYASDITLYYHDDHLSEEFMKKLTKLFSLTTLIETGTYAGDTAKRGAKYFDQIYSVEIHPRIFRTARNNLKNFPSIHLYKDTSYNFLNYPEIRNARNSLFWLDAHYCGGGTGTIYDNNKWLESPLKKEIETIFGYFRPDQVILIDDLRGYLNLRDEDKKGRIYTTISELFRLTKQLRSGMQFCVLGDMGLIFDQDFFPVSISPYVEACTASYCFNHNQPYTEQELLRVLEAEKFIMTSEPSDELDSVISDLCRFPLNKSDLSAYYPTIWHGLRMIKMRNFSEGCRDFNKLIEAAPEVHDRIYYYLSLCYQGLGDSENRHKALNCVSDSTQSAIKLLL